MSVTSIFRKLNTAKIFPRIEIVSQFVRDAFNSLNALYESLWDVAAPGAASQTFIGHDHCLEGGGPFICNSQLSYGGPCSTEFYTLSNAIAGDAPNVTFLGYHYISPQLAHGDRGTCLEAQICYQAQYADFKVWFNGQKDFAVELKETAASGDEQHAFAPEPIRIPITKDATYVELYLFAECSRNSGATTSLKIFSINIAETAAATQPQEQGKLGTREITRGAISSLTFLRYFDVLDDDLAAAWEWFDSYLTTTLYSAVNFILEGILDWATPGASDQYIKGHDHSISDWYSAGYGGRVVPRGKIFSTYWRNSSWWCYVNVTYGRLNYIDESSPKRRTTSTPHSSTLPLFKAYVTQGLNTTFTGVFPSYVYDKPWLDAWVYIYWAGNYGNLSILIYNATYNKSSTATVVSAGWDGWVRITEIPCREGRWNDFYITVAAASASDNGALARCCGIILGEIYTYDGNLISYTSSDGSRILGIARSGVEKAEVEP